MTVTTPDVNIKVFKELYIPFQKKMIFKILAFLDLFAVSLVVPALGNHFLNNDIVWIGSVYGIAQFFSQPYFGRIADRIGTKNTILFSLAMSALSYFLLGSTSNVLLVLISRAMAGVFKQTQELSRLALINNTPQVNRARAIGLFNSIGSAGFIIGPTIGGHVREILGESGFYTCAKLTSAVFALNFLLVAVFMVESERKMKKEVKEENNNNPGIVSVLIQMWDLCSIRLCLTMSILMARFAIPILTERAFGPARAGYVTSFTALAGTLSASGVSLILPYVLKKLTVQMAEFYVTLGCASSLALMGLTWNPIEPNWIGFLSFISINCFFTQSSRILLTEMTASRCPAEIRGYAMGTVTSLTAVSRAACDVILAQLMVFGDLAPLYSGAMLSIVASVLTYCQPKKTKIE